MVEQGGNALAAYMAEVLAILRACMTDPFHEVVVPTCDCMAALARQLRRRLQPVSKQLVADVLPLTTHRRKAVRGAAVRAARQLMFCGAHEMILDMVAWRDPNSVAIKAFYEPDPKVRSTPALSPTAQAVRRRGHGTCCTQASSPLRPENRSSDDGSIPAAPAALPSSQPCLPMFPYKPRAIDHVMGQSTCHG